MKNKQVVLRTISVIFFVISLSSYVWLHVAGFEPWEHSTPVFYNYAVGPLFMIIFGALCVVFYFKKSTLIWFVGALALFLESEITSSRLLNMVSYEKYTSINMHHLYDKIFYVNIVIKVVLVIMLFREVWKNQRE